MSGPKPTGGPSQEGSERRVAVTGLGLITAAGIGPQAFWNALGEARSPVGPVRRFDASRFRSRVAAEVESFEPTRYMDGQRARRLDRFGQFAVAAARQALDDAGLEPERMAPERVGVQMGSALGGIAHAEAQADRFRDGGLRSVDPRLALSVYGGAASCQVALEFGFQGPNSTNGMSCASGTMAVGEGWRLVRSGGADVVLAGGVEAPLAPLTFGSFALIRAMSTRNDDAPSACRPFDAERDGFVMGEGSAVLVLEELESARGRGARVYAEVNGYGNSNDAHHMTAPRPDGSQAARALKDALGSAGLTSEEVDYVNAHGSSTPLNDAVESQTIRRVLGEAADGVPVSGTKPYYGHALGASGAIEAAVCSLALRHQWIPPTLNLERPGDGCDLDYVPAQGRRVALSTAVSTSFGFGGINAVLALTRPAREPDGKPGSPSRVAGELPSLPCV